MTGILPEITASPFIQNPWKRFRNTTAEAIPPFSVMRITGSENHNGALRFTVAKPNGTQYTAYLVNGPLAVPAGKDGVCTTLTQAGYLAYDSGDGTPALGEDWGAKSGQWTAAKNVAGFFVCGGTITSAGVNAVAAIQISTGGDELDVVEIDASGGSPRYLTAANADGVHKGLIKRANGAGGFASAGDCWVMCVDDFNVVDKDVVLVNGNYYGPFKKAGDFTSDGDTYPLYVGVGGEWEFVCKADADIAKGATGTVSLYNSSDLSDSGINLANALALYNPVTAGLWASVTRMGDRWVVREEECGEDEESDYN